MVYYHIGTINDHVGTTYCREGMMNDRVGTRYDLEGMIYYREGTIYDRTGSSLKFVTVVPQVDLNPGNA